MARAYTGPTYKAGVVKYGLTVWTLRSTLFLARLGSVTGEEKYFTQAAEEITCYANLLQDSQTGLFLPRI